MIQLIMLVVVVIIILIRRRKKGVTIVVLGDIGHSPRMRYHAASLLPHMPVQLVGYVDSDPGPGTVYPLRRTTTQYLVLKALFQAWTLLFTLCTIPATEFMLVQNPPSIPTLLVAGIICRLRGTTLVIDWHNLGYTILGLKLGQDHVLVKASRVYEKYVSRLASHHLAVSNAMCARLKEYGIHAKALYDRPASHFQPVSDRLGVLRRLPQTAQHAEAISTGQTRLVVSSTSWTPDEDFSVLLDALDAYHAADLLVVITGKGPLKQKYEAQIDTLKQAGRLQNVEIKTAWLSIDDYAALLGAADLGVSLHCSSSGLDLPMKVVDMFGCGLPVVGFTFPAWPELVTEGVNGRGFVDAAGLCALLKELFGQPAVLKDLRRGALRESRRRWEDEWPAVASIFLNDS